MDNTVKEYDVTLSKVGYVHVMATSEKEAMRLASRKKDKDITWISTEPTDAELIEESAGHSEPTEDQRDQSYIINAMPIDHNVPTWRIGDTAWFMPVGAEEAEEGTIVVILDSDKGTFMTLITDNQTSVELPKEALFLGKADAEDQAKGIVPAYNIKLTMTGRTCIIARDKTSAAKLAVNFPSNVTWEKPTITSIKEKEEGQE